MNTGDPIPWESAPATEQDRLIERAQYLIDTGYVPSTYEAQTVAREIWARQQISNNVE